MALITIILNPPNHVEIVSAPIPSMFSCHRVVQNTCSKATAKPRPGLIQQAYISWTEPHILHFLCIYKVSEYTQDRIKLWWLMLLFTLRLFRQAPPWPTYAYCTNIGGMSTVTNPSTFHRAGMYTKLRDCSTWPYSSMAPIRILRAAHNANEWMPKTDNTHSIDSNMVLKP